MSACRGKASAEQISLTAGGDISEHTIDAAFLGQQAHPGLPGTGGSAAGPIRQGCWPDESSGNSSSTRNGDRRDRGSNGGADPLHTASSSSGAGHAHHAPLPMNGIAHQPSPGLAPPSVAQLPPAAMPMDVAGASASAAALPGCPAAGGLAAAVKVEGGQAAGGLGGGLGCGAGTAAEAAVPRRVIANRQSAARSKERRRGYVIGLEQSVKTLTQQINEQQGHLHSLASNSATLCESCHVLQAT